MRRDTRILTHPGLEPLWESMERTRRQQQLAAILLMLLGLSLLLFGVAYRSAWQPFVGGVLATAALYWLFRLLSDQPISYWRRELRDNPQDIVWVYSVVTDRMPFGFKVASLGTLYLVDRSGDVHCFGMKPVDLRLVTKTLNRVLPHAEFGYTPEREQRLRGEVTNFTGRGARNLLNRDDESSSRS